ncbi:hypothetical protein MANES_12G077250v8 [Manihot esculenta]|uniref:Uncharacterized protein n=1 Tax=Manihot esculenta TaxID=3983 RepID=A0ACB7GPY7_MANES|nr:hypothetical protein MANES_12G077250v8 [Manihot esculenta]
MNGRQSSCIHEGRQRGISVFITIDKPILPEASPPHASSTLHVNLFHNILIIHGGSTD